jgi:hypothetical protein
MRPECIEKVQAAAGGRKLSESKIKAIDDAISGKMRELARVDSEWSAKSYDQRMTEAAQAAALDIEAAASRKEMLAGMQAVKVAETQSRIADMKKTSAMKLTQSQAVIRDIQNSQNYVHAVHDDAVSGLGDMLDAASNKDGTGLLRNLGMRIFNLDNPAMTADVVREVFKGADGHTGNKVAKAGAQAWLDTIEKLRLRFNAAGGDVGKLDYGYLTPLWSSERIAKVSPDQFAADLLPHIDRRRYLNEDGSLMNNQQIAEILKASQPTLAREGANKTEPGQFKGTGARANAGSQHRVIHFKDGDGYMAAMEKYGEGSLYDSMLGHIGAMARNIGLVERYGPNPEQTFRVQADIAKRADNPNNKTLKEVKDSRSFGNTPQAYWDILSGKTSSPENLAIANFGANVRNVQTAAKLGGAVITSLTDVGTIAATLHYDRLSYFDMLKNLGKQLDKDHREFLQAHGVIAESLTSTMNRWTGDHMTNSLTGKVANSVMKLSFMNAWTDGLRGAFSATMMQGFAKKLGKTWAKLDEWDQWLMARKGITEEDWNIISQATPTERGGAKYLTRDSILATKADGAEQAATKWMAFVSDEAQVAIINPDMATRAAATWGGMPAGTLKGEAARCFMQFKSFPTAMITRHLGRLFDTPQGLEGAPAGFGAQTETGAAINRMAVLAGLNVSLMMLGAIVLQEKSILAGKDPYDMTEPKFWAKALGQGGGLGYVGDFLTKDPTEQRGNNFEQAGGVLLGPAGGAVAGLAGDLMLTNMWEAAKGKDTHAGAEALRWGNSQVPYVGLWQVRGAWDHWFMHNAQEALNPGYLARMRSRAMKDWNQDYYWQPGEALPGRAPDMGRIIGD